MGTKHTWVAFTGAVLVIGVAIIFFLKTGGDTPMLPSNEDNEKIALNTTLAFAQAVNAEDLSLLRLQTTEEFKARFNQDQLEETFRGFIEQKINLTPVEKLKPIFRNAPLITEDGTLILNGYFPTRPSQVEFDYNYLWRNGSWKINGISLEINPVDSD